MYEDYGKDEHKYAIEHLKEEINKLKNEKKYRNIAQVSAFAANLSKPHEPYREFDTLFNTSIHPNDGENRNDYGLNYISKNVKPYLGFGKKC